MGMHEARGTMAKAMKELMLRWQETRGSWDDARAEQFEKMYIEMLQNDIRTAANAMDQIANVLHAARRDCGE